MARTITIGESPLHPDDPAEKKEKIPALLSIKQAITVSRGYILELNRSARYSEDNPAAREGLFETVHTILKQESQVGGPNDFHNYAVLLGGNGFESLACDILDCGLRRFPVNVDLLADYLVYGMNCERQEQCDIHSQTLDSIPKEDWTWRAFAFGISYARKMMQNFAATEEARKYYKKRVAQLSTAYKKYLPYEEGGYRETAKLHTKKPEMELKLLEEALTTEALGACTTCAFEKAQILFKQKKYEGALDAINRSLEDSINETQTGINEYYLYFLRGLCKYAILFQKLKKQEEIPQEDVEEIYSDFDKSLYNLDEDYKEKVRIRARNLVKSTGIPVPESFEDLCELTE